MTLAAAGTTAVIPPKANRRSPRRYDRHLYKARHLVENFFAKLKQFRAIATRYDKTARNFLTAVNLAATFIWLNSRQAVNRHPSVTPPEMEVILEITVEIGEGGPDRSRSPPL